ncbi:MAG: hypothetical protein LUQ59_12160, partial [Methanothrix sp.]|nr:hypothetical protein [Methanothrix sp.]
GARVGARLGQLEASVFGYVGRDTAAVFISNLILVNFPQFNLQIVDRYPRINAGGVTASYPLGERVLLRLESVYFNSPERVHDDFLQIAGGMEYALDDWRLVISYLRDDTVIRAPDDVTNRGERRFFQSFVFGELRYDAGGRLQGRVRGGYDATGEFWLLQPEISYRLWRGLRVALLGDVIDSNRVAYEDNFSSYFDSVRHEDRLGTRLEYHF